MTTEQMSIERFAYLIGRLHGAMMCSGEEMEKVDVSFDVIKPPESRTGKTLAEVFSKIDADIPDINLDDMTRILT